MDQAIHKLNVGHYTLDVKVSQLMDRLTRVDGKTITTRPLFFFSMDLLPLYTQYFRHLHLIWIYSMNENNE